MATRNIPKPPLVGYQYNKLTDTTTELLCDFQYYNVTHEDAAKREKPVGSLQMIKQGTTLGHVEQTRVDNLVTISKGNYIYNVSICMLYGGVGPVDYSRLLSDGGVQSQLLNKIRSQIKGKGVNLAQMLGEYRQTGSLFRDLCERFYMMTMAVHKRDPRILIYDYYSPRGRLRKSIPRRVRRDISNAWLQYIYGVKPLMNDINEAIVTLKTAAISPPVLHLSSRIATRPPSLTDVVPSIWVPGFTGTCTLSASRVNKMSAVVVMRNLELLQSLGAYGLTNPAALAWELTRFSFVVDWWVNVGEVLSSLDNCIYMQEGWAIESQKYEQMTYIEGMGGGAYYKQRRYQRFAPISVGSVSSLSYKPSISKLHIANGLALLSQLRF